MILKAQLVLIQLYPDDFSVQIAKSLNVRTQTDSYLNVFHITEYGGQPTR